MSNLINSYSLSSVIGIGTDTPNQNLTVVGGISGNALVYDRTGNSSQWNSTYTTLCATSGTFATKSFVQSNYLNLTGGSVNGNLVVTGNLSAQGTAFFANTIFTTTSALCAQANSSGPALYVSQAGSGDLASFYDLTPTPVEVLHVGASIGIPGVGVYTSNPNVELTVNGRISASQVIYASGGNSNQWNTAYNTSTVYQSASSSFATKSTLSNYLPLSGGTLTGGLTGTTVKANTFYGVQGTNSSYDNGIDPPTFGAGGACGCIQLNGGDGDATGAGGACGGRGGYINLKGGRGCADNGDGGSGGCIIMIGGSGDNGNGPPAGSINTTASCNYRGGNICTSASSNYGGGDIITACGGSIITSGDNGNPGGSIITCGCFAAGGSINTSGGNGGNGGNISTCNNGGYINTTGSAYSGGYINTSASSLQGGGFINTSSSGAYNGGYINTSASGYFNGGYINTFGGGYINTSGNDNGDGSGLIGGYINTSASGSSPGGSINTSNGGGCINTSNCGGCINTSGALGGKINTSNGGGNINTTSGYIQLGNQIYSNVTTLSATATANRTILLPDSSGTIVVATSGIRNFSAPITSTSVTTVTKTIQVFDSNGNSIGYIPIYSTRI